MANLNAVIVPAKALKGGRHKIRISVAHNGKTRYIATDIILDSESEFSKGAVRKRPDASLLNTKLRGIIQKYQDVIDELDYPATLSCEELVFHLKNNSSLNNMTLQDVFEECMATSSAKASTIETYRRNWTALGKIINMQTPIKSFSRTHVYKIIKVETQNSKRNSTIHNYLATLSQIINYAKNNGYVFFKIDPFAGIQRPKASVRNSWLSVEDIRKIRDFPFKRRNQVFARDMFMLSYYLGGINMEDLVKINFNECNGKLSYVRSKNARRNQDPVEFKIQPEAQNLIDKYKDKDGFIAYKTVVSYRLIKPNLNYTIPTFRKILEIPNLVFYSARKSFSQHAHELGVNTSVIDYILGHKSNSGGTALYSYIYVTPEMATDAIRKVLDNLK